MKTLKQIVSVNSVSRITVTLFQVPIDKPYVIEIQDENIRKETPYSVKTSKEHYDNYFHAHYRFTQLAMWFLLA